MITNKYSYKITNLQKLLQTQETNNNISPAVIGTT